MSNNSHMTAAMWTGVLVQWRMSGLSPLTYFSWARNVFNGSTMNDSLTVRPMGMNYSKITPWLERELGQKWVKN